MLAGLDQRSLDVVREVPKSQGNAVERLEPAIDRLDRPVGDDGVEMGEDLRSAQGLLALTISRPPGSCSRPYRQEQSNEDSYTTSQGLNSNVPRVSTRHSRLSQLALLFTTTRRRSS